MADPWGLDDQVALVHDERLSAVLVDDANPAATDVDDLQGDAVVMNPVRDGAAFGYRDMRRDVAPTEPAWDKVAIEHPRPALRRRRSGAGHQELTLEGRQAIRRSGSAGARGQPN